MLEILQFIFSSPWVFFGSAWLLMIVTGFVGNAWSQVLAVLLRKGR